jgi:hypothetical protein
MHACIEQSNGPVPLWPFRSWPGCIINTSGYDFRNEQVPAADAIDVDAQGRIVGLF